MLRCGTSCHRYRKSGQRPRIRPADRLPWSVMSRLWSAAVAHLADVSRLALPGSGIGRLLCCPNRYLSSTVRLCRSRPGTTTNRPLQRNGASNGTMDSAAVGRSLSDRSCAPLSDSRLLQQVRAARYSKDRKPANSASPGSDFSKDQRPRDLLGWRGRKAHGRFGGV